MALHHPGKADLVSLRPRSETMQMSRGRTVFVFQRDGHIEKENPVEGLYIYDTRVLSRYEWRMNGKRPQFSCGSNVRQSDWLAYFIQAPENWSETPEKDSDPLQETLELRLMRSVGEGLHEDVQIINHTQVATSVKLELDFEVDFISRDEAEGDRKQHGRMETKWSQPAAAVWELMQDYRARHKYSHQNNKGTAEMHRGLKLRIQNASSPPEYSENRIAFQIELSPHGKWHACISWLAYTDGRLLPLESDCPFQDTSEWDERRVRLLNASTSFALPHAEDLTSTVHRILNRARLDLCDLRLYDLDSADGIAFAAGIPSYAEVFGRDLLATGWQASILGHELLGGGMRVLADRQASERNDWRDAQPGRMPHEIHTDPLSVLNFRPKSLYFGEVSANFLFPIAVSELWHWTGDLKLVRSFKDAAIRALDSADTYNLDSTGFYRYQTRSEQGVKNQGWKDSADAIVYPDGSQVDAPIGTCEMQAFAYVAKLHFSEVLWWLGERDLARKYYREANDLKSRFNEKFWMEDEGFFGMGIDSNGDLIRTVASDPGHCLLSGIVDESRIKRVAARMLREDLFSGWGIRTLSSNHPAYNPFSYHRGSVWPVENAAFVLAFSRYGLHGEMHELAKAILEAADLFEHDRLPEVFAGHQRTPEAPFPGLYTRACWPQAWSASAPISILQALVGIYPYAPANVLFLDPQLPDWLPEIEIERMRIGKASVSIRFFRNAKGKTQYKILDMQGSLHVVHQPSPWSITSGWAERVHDAVMSLIPHPRTKSA